MLAVQRIVEISSNNRYLKIHRGFLVIKDKDTLLGQIPLDDIGAVIVHGYGHIYSHQVLSALAERNIPLVLCNSKHLPESFLWPAGHNHEQAQRFRAQVDLRKAQKDRAWKSIVQSKIAMQISVLNLAGVSSTPLKPLLKKVTSGDKTNIESEAARKYWGLLFGNDFRRDRLAEDINLALNYGYTLLRSAVARALVAVGLHPTLGIHHSNRANIFCLVDDLMEPYRPIVDFHCLSIDQDKILNNESKMLLSGSLTTDVITGDRTSPTQVHIGLMASSYTQFIQGKMDKLFLPESLAETS
ncbi:type II CRISPR-associated endonuclease Cas1 [Zooshikella ganghwensis]|uniref:type II CRISPR-associated endonuclease Cas1 n=1 Tax=Zooshikella ganghwensis TaxID=202772 RepID=UPI00057065D6|nr:type II CRISPR-associated endonuclease Cas1 [Zooshikella ganghwensis]